MTRLVVLRVRRVGVRASGVAIALAAATCSVAGALTGAGMAGCHPDWPIVIHHPGGVLARPPSGSASPLACATETGHETSESTLAVTPSGAVFYSPARTENSLAFSLDRGSTWQLTYPPQMQYTSLWNTVDPQVVADPRTGRVFWVRATGDLRTAPLLVDESPLPWQASTAIAYAHGFQVYSTADNGNTWTTADYHHELTGDWEKMFVGPPPAARTGAPQPRGYPDIVYVCANAPFEVSGPGRSCYKSLDGGATFNLAGYVFPSASSPDVCPALAAGTGVVASDGTVFQPATCRNGAYLTVSRDEGSTYKWLPIARSPPASGYSGGVALAIDRADNLYALWLRNDQLSLVTSRDSGQTWSAPLAIAAPGVHQLALPALAAGPPGDVAVTYYGSSDPSAKRLSAYITETRDALAQVPLLYSGAINDPTRPIFQDQGGNTTPRADYVGGAYDSAGTFWGGVVKQLGSPDPSGRMPTTGYVGRLVFPGPKR